MMLANEMASDGNLIVLSQYSIQRSENFQGLECVTKFWNTLYVYVDIVTGYL